MNKKLITTLFIFLIFIFAIQFNTFAVVVSTDKEVNSGSGNVTVSVTSKQALGAYTLKLTDTAGLTLVSAAKGQTGSEVSADYKTITGSSSDGMTSLGSFTFKVPTVSKDTTYNVKFSITGMETPDLDPIADETNTAVIKVIAPKSDNNDSNAGSNNTSGNTGSNSGTNTGTSSGSGNSTGSTTPSTPTKSSDTSLKSLSISPFGKISKASTGIYDITVDNKYDKVTVTAVANSSKAKVSGNGDYDLEEGTNQIKIVVTAENGSTETHKIKIRRKAAEVQEPITPPNVIEKNEEDKKEEVVKEEKELGLLNLVITGVQLNPSFSPDVYEYTAEFTEDTDSLEVITTANIEGATVEVAGNTNLVVGENLITIMVKSEDGKVTKTYQVTVTKNEPEVVPAVTDNTVNDNNENTVLADINEDQELRNQIGKIIIIAAAAIIAVILFGIIIIAYTKKKDSESVDKSQKKTGNKKEKLGKDAFVVAVDEDESYRELEKLSEIRNKNRFENKEITVKDKVDRILDENTTESVVEKEDMNLNEVNVNSNVFPEDLDEIEVSVPVLDELDSLNGRRGRRFK